MDTIFALSSGAPPAAIAVMRISGPHTANAVRSLAGKLPAPRRASLVSLRDKAGSKLDQALILWFPGPASATGEDCAEFHLHGGRAIVSAVETALGEVDSLRPARPGEFTRRSFANGRIDLAQAEGLADLLEAETELQRRSAMALASGALSEKVTTWREEVLVLSALVESALDFADEDDVDPLPSDFTAKLSALAGELADWLERPRARALKEGYRVALAGPPNAGKSTLFNALVESEAAIASPTAGTTRDVLTRSVALGGIPLTFVDMAGLRDESSDDIEAIGIGRARDEMVRADLVLWLGPEGEGPDSSWEIEPRIDQGDVLKASPDYRISAVSGRGMDELRSAIMAHARGAMPKPGDVALNERQSGLIAEAADALRGDVPDDLLILGENLRVGRSAFDRLIGRSGTEDMLDALFGRFCIGK
ncbi:tRNA uridine-5-carboxymethylaminomethyl(34) synthesis GTPase MnmE [Altererythrobacter sp. ZODW24]|uniref:tRNA uridine-5-carboxymethylaminomethyl(34) synthesis GTPase MnmE n=1 Tax=Altererythrobacter sp. ZODW24 TaxID=2185142 RepID=UPI000DF7AAB5|nr:tRNA uridine-5-carboxymethylaminomethyl(34) synthesis GTPase MnmE [Altererythrobacter sp. ZODW24]